MTLHRIRDARRRTQPPEGEGVSAPERAQRRRAAEQTVRSLERKTERGPEGGLSRDDYDERVAPAAAWRKGLCDEIELSILMGQPVEPELVRAALAVPADGDVATYTQKYRDDLLLCCLNHGIDPETGERHDQ